MDKPIFEGVYPDFDSVPAKGDGFNGATWSGRSVESALAHMDAVGQGVFPAFETSLLPIVAALLARDRQPLRILDFGGGLGGQAIETFAALHEGVELEFHIVEVDEICVKGRELLGDQPRVTFHADWPDDPETVHLAHLGSSLQYVQDWGGVLRKIAAFSPETILFSDLLAGDIPSYASGQNYHESVIPCWFLNFGEVEDLMGELGYTLLFQARYVSTVLGHRGPIPQDNFPKDRRLGHSRVALFSHKELK